MGRSVGGSTPVRAFPLALVAVLVVGGCTAPGALAAQAGGISGTVIDVTTHSPIEGVEVCAFPMAGEGLEESEGNSNCSKTSALGEYAIAGLEAGSFTVIFGWEDFAALFGGPVSSLDYAIQAFDGKEPPSEPTPVAVTPGNTTKGIDAELKEGSEISGTVTVAASGAPASGVIACALRLVGGSPTELLACAASGADGTYTIRGIPDGEFDVIFLSVSANLASQFYPGKELPTEASVVTISAPKEIKTGIDAAMQPRAPVTSGPEAEPGPTGPSGVLGGLGGLPGGGGLTGPRVKPKLPVRLDSPLISVRRRAVALVRLSCAGASGCRGKLILSVKRVAHRRGRTLAWTVPLGAERYTLRRGSHTTVRIRLDAHARALLGVTRGSLDVRLAIAQRGSSSHRIELEHVILVERRASSKR